MVVGGPDTDTLTLTRRLRASTSRGCLSREMPARAVGHDRDSLDRFSEELGPSSANKEARSGILTGPSAVCESEVPPGIPSQPQHIIKTMGQIPHKQLSTRHL
jgi:hypothetical protein